METLQDDDDVRLRFRSRFSRSLPGSLDTHHDPPSAGTRLLRRQVLEELKPLADKMHVSLSGLQPNG